jgi:predicted enzyme related to lactoylglutathione lyase
MASLLINLDVDDIERAVRFYTDALELRVGRRFDDQFIELLGAGAPIYLLKKAAGTAPFLGAGTRRDYGRHWTPVHLDFVVDDIQQALERVLAHGAQQEAEVSEHAYGLLALCSDPFGHGFCLLEFRGRGYDELLAANARA